MPDQPKDSLNPGTSSQYPLSPIVHRSSRVWAYLVLFIIVLTAIFILFRQKHSTLNKTTTQMSGKPAVFNFQHAPAVLPSGIPIEQGALMIKNSSGSVIGTSSSFSTVEFVSNKSSTDNLNLYQTWLRTNNWQNINSTSTKPSQTILVANQGKANLNILIFTSPSAKVNVLITYSFIK